MSRPYSITRVCTADSLGIDDLAGTVDFLLLFAVLHEVPGKEALFSQICRALKPGGRMLFAEPKGHVNQNAFDASVALALRNGFSPGRASACGMAQPRCTA